jgi:hypothetical protein
MAGHVARMGDNKNSYKILAKKPEGKILLKRTRRSWVNNIKMDFRGDGVECTGLILPRVRTDGRY